MSVHTRPTLTNNVNKGIYASYSFYRRPLFDQNTTTFKVKNIYICKVTCVTNEIWLRAQDISYIPHFMFNCSCNWDMTLFSHVDWFHDLGICQLYYVDPLNKIGIFIYYSSCKLNLEIWVELYSQHYAHELLFFPRIFAENIVLFS